MRTSNKHDGRRSRIAPALAAVVVATLALVGCSGDGSLTAAPQASSSGEYTELRSGEIDPSEADTTALDALPESVRDSYAGFWNSTRLGPNPYEDFVPSEAPWKFCYSSSYQGNTWRVEGLDTAELFVEQLREQGLVEGELVVADANNDATLQATQVSNMTQQGCDVIFVMQPPSIGLCQAFDGAREAGALVVVMQTGTDCTNVMQSDFGAYAAGYQTASWLAGQVDEGSTVVMCNGIPGVAAAEARQLGARAALDEAGLTVDEITGEWNAATAKSQMVNYLSTHQGDVSGVWDGGTCAVAASQAFEQSGRDLPVITGFEGGCGWLANWKDNGNESIGLAAGAGQGVFEAFKIAMRMLAGQKPLVNTMLYPLAEINAENFDTYYDPAMTINSACSAQPQDGESVPDSYYDDLFEGGEPAVELESVLPDLPIA